MTPIRLSAGEIVARAIDARAESETARRQARKTRADSAELQQKYTARTNRWQRPAPPMLPAP